MNREDRVDYRGMWSWSIITSQQQQKMKQKYKLIIGGKKLTNTKKQTSMPRVSKLAISPNS